MQNNDFKVNNQFLRFKGKDVIIGFKNRDEIEGKIMAIDNYLNIALKTDNQIKVIKGGKITFISIKDYI
ncbi:MAG: LSM domain protein [Methanobrevibacter sp.]|jgi:small nuclear ribonucleoprotein (snRNP)-like protein|nr:LSM domain protein [Candidatus Methanovirga basalitermitum]